MKIHGAVLEGIGGERPHASGRPVAVSELELDRPRLVKC
jgi:hypothetical protein